MAVLDDLQSEEHRALHVRQSAKFLALLIAEDARRERPEWPNMGCGMFVIRVIAWANGEHCPFQDQYCKSFNFDADKGRGHGSFTFHLNDALKFPDAASAMEFWRTRSRVRPIRPDGEENRPFTALSVAVEEPRAWH